MRTASPPAVGGSPRVRDGRGCGDENAQRYRTAAVHTAVWAPAERSCPPLPRHTAVLASQRESSPTGNSLSRVLLRRGRANQRASSRDVFPSSRTRCRRRRSAGGTRDPRRVRLNAVRLRGTPRGRKVASILNPAGRCKTGADDGRRLTLHRRRRSSSRATCSGKLAGAKGRAPRSPAAQ